MPRATSTAPYPYGRWPSLPRSALGGAGALRRALESFDAATARATAQALLGCPVELSVGAPADCPPSPGGLPDGNDCLLRLRLEQGASPTTLALLVPQELAAALVDRVLGGDGTAVHMPGDALDELSLGALGYLAARLLGAGGGVLRLGTLSGRAELDADGASPPAPRLLWPLTLRLDGREWTLRALTPAVLPGEAPPRRPRWPPAMELRLCAHAGTVTLARAQLEGLQPGDALLPERCRLQKSADGSFDGEVVLHVEGARRTRWRCRAGGRELRIEHMDDDGGMAMGEGRRIEAAGRAGALAGDAPVELCLELARFTLTLEELGKLAPGDVLSTGQPIGRQVVLRAGGVELGAGELVEVEGEVGVRLTRVGTPQKLDAPAGDSD